MAFAFQGGFNRDNNLPIMTETGSFHRMQKPLLIAVSALLLAACDIPGLGPDPRIAQREADGKAIGAACRHALRGIEDCYYQNEKAPKTAVFEGWKEMDLYMRENKIEGIPPKEAKATEPDEVIVEMKKPKTASAEKPGAELKSKTDVAMKAAKPADKSK